MGKLIDNPGFDTLLSTKVDEFGEVLLEPYVEQIKVMAAGMMKEFRLEERPPLRI